jgi:hypothetical protein
MHTPGPWKTYKLADDTETYGDHAGCFIVTTNNDETEICGVVSSEDNAHLLSAAPELLEALKGLVGLATLRPGHLQDYKAAVNIAQTAIKKAENR